MTSRLAQLGVHRTMDTDSSYEDHAEAEGEYSSTEDHTQAVIPHDLGISNIDTKSEQPSLDNAKGRKSTETREERWERLQSQYSDQYLNLFNENCADGIEVANNDLNSTQIGLVNWSGSEKEQFFLALSRRSKADVRGIATSIGSKSELEVHEYLRLLQEEDQNRNLYSREATNIGHANISAAAELSIECEALLERAADALAAYQDRFDRTIGDQLHHGAWIIDHVQAEAHDKLVDRAEDDISSVDSPSTSLPVPAGRLFRLSSWLLLTSGVFMNSDPSQNENNWTTHAAQDEEPGITQEAIADLYQLAVFHLRKVIQTSIFCSESRIRSTRDRGYTAKALVKEQDVAAALSILGLQSDSSHFWLGLARRNQLKVVDDRRKTGRGRRTPLGYDELEGILAETLVPKRGRRSGSSASESVSVPTNSVRVGKCCLSDTCDTAGSITSEQSEQEAYKQSRYPSYASLSGDTEMWSTQINRGSDDAEPSPAFSNEEELSMFEDDQDRQLEALDQVSSRHEELKLYRYLDRARRNQMCAF